MSELMICATCRNNTDDCDDTEICKACVRSHVASGARPLNWQPRVDVTPPQPLPESAMCGLDRQALRGKELLAAETTLLRMGYTYNGGQEWETPLGKAPAFSAPDLLDAAAGHMRDRAATYDKPDGQRSMGKTVKAFNTITGRDLRESEGWLLMALLKMVRSEQRSDPHRDSIEDLVAYGALFGEARLGGR